MRDKEKAAFIDRERGERMCRNKKNERETDKQSNRQADR